MAAFLAGGPSRMRSFLASGSRVRGVFMPRSRALAQSSIRDLLKKRNRPHRNKEVLDTAAVLRDLSLIIGHGFLLIGNLPRSLRFHCRTLALLPAVSSMTRNTHLIGYFVQECFSDEGRGTAGH